MAIAYDAVKTVVINTTPTAFDVGSGTDRFLLVGVLKQGNQTATAVTYNGTSMTKIATLSDGAVNGTEENTLWILINPDSGSNNIAATFSGSGTYGLLGAVYSGVDQTTGYEAVATYGSSSSTPRTLDLTTLTDNSWAVGFFRTAGTFTPDSNTTTRGSQSNINMVDSNALITPAGAYSLGYTNSMSCNLLGCALIPAGAGPSTSIKSIGGVAQADIKSVEGVILD